MPLGSIHRTGRKRQSGSDRLGSIALLSRRFGRFFFGAFPLDWHFLSRGYLVFRFGRAEEPVVKRTTNLLQTLDAMRRQTGAREPVRLVRAPNHYRRAFPELQRAGHSLLAL